MPNKETHWKIKKNNIRVTAFTNVISFDKTNLQISQNWFMISMRKL